MKIISIANGAPLDSVWTDAFVAELGSLGTVTLRDAGTELTADATAALVRSHDVAIVGWDSRPLPAELATAPGSLRFVCSYSGSIRHSVPRELVDAGIWVSNWGDLPAMGVAEGALTLALTLLKAIPAAHRVQHTPADDSWGIPASEQARQGHLGRCTVGVYGMGAIGRHFADLVRPFGSRLVVFDPYVPSVPLGCEQADSLEELFGQSDIVAIHAGLSDETAGSVSAEVLARLRDGGILVNTARGAIVDQAALVGEVESGRLRAGLDVLEPDGVLAADHPFRRRDNVVLTFHQVEAHDDWPPHDGLTAMQQRCVDNIARFTAGQAPEWLFDVDRYDRST